MIKKNEMTYILTIDKKLHQKIKIMAVKEKKSMSFIITDILDKFLKGKLKK